MYVVRRPSRTPRRSAKPSFSGVAPVRRRPLIHDLHPYCRAPPAIAPARSSEALRRGMTGGRKATDSAVGGIAHSRCRTAGARGPRLPRSIHARVRPSTRNEQDQSAHGGHRLLHRSVHRHARLRHAHTSPPPHARSPTLRSVGDRTAVRRVRGHDDRGHAPRRTVRRPPRPPRTAARRAPGPGRGLPAVRRRRPVLAAPDLPSDAGGRRRARLGGEPRPHRRVHPPGTARAVPRPGHEHGIRRHSRGAALGRLARPRSRP